MSCAIENSFSRYCISEITLRTVQRINLVSCLLVGLVIVALVPHTVSAQAGCSPIPCVRVKGVNAPSTVSVGQPLTVTVTVAYAVTPLGLWVGIAILDQYENGKPFPATGATNSRCLSPSAESICFDTNPPRDYGDLTASFTLTGLNQTRMWYLYVFGMVVYGGSSVVSSDVKSVGVNVTPAPIPEVTSPLLLLSLTIIVTVCLVKRKPYQASSDS
jgi:hypothetical protein